jgi:hypothetical protein
MRIAAATMDLRWQPWVDPEKICRLHEADAPGILDEKPLDQVAFALFVRCQSVITVTEIYREGA